MRENTKVGGKAISEGTDFQKPLTPPPSEAPPSDAPPKGGGSTGLGGTPVLAEPKKKNIQDSVNRLERELAKGKALFAQGVIESEAKRGNQLEVQTMKQMIESLAERPGVHTSTESSNPNHRSANDRHEMVQPSVEDIEKEKRGRFAGFDGGHSQGGVAFRFSSRSRSRGR